VEARLVRDAHLGSIWEGTSNIVAIDAIERAVGREGADAALEQSLRHHLSRAAALPKQLRTVLEQLVPRAFAFARDVASTKDQSAMRRAASGLYNVTSAVLLAGEGARLSATQDDSSRAALAGLVVRHKLVASDPLTDRPSADIAEYAALINGRPIAAEQCERFIGFLRLGD
jgi:hypothetical protein